MAAGSGMSVIGLLVTILAMGTPSVFARRGVLANGIPAFKALGNVPIGKTITLVDVPGLKITSLTEAPSVGIKDVRAILNGDLPPLTLTMTDKIEGTWLNPVTFTSTTEIRPKLPSSSFLGAVDKRISPKPFTTVHAWGGFSFPGFNFPPLPFPFFGKPPASSPASAPSPASSASSPSPRASSPSSPTPRASTTSPHSSPSSPPGRASEPSRHSSASSPASPPKN